MAPSTRNHLPLSYFAAPAQKLSSNSLMKLEVSDGQVFWAKAHPTLDIAKVIVKKAGTFK